MLAKATVNYPHCEAHLALSVMQPWWRETSLFCLLIIICQFETPFRDSLAAERGNRPTTPGHCLCPGPLLYSEWGDGPAVVAAASVKAPAAARKDLRRGLFWGYHYAAAALPQGQGMAAATPARGPRPSSPHLTGDCRASLVRQGEHHTALQTHSPLHMDIHCHQMERNLDRNLYKIHILVKCYHCFIL